MTEVCALADKGFLRFLVHGEIGRRRRRPGGGGEGGSEGEEEREAQEEGGRGREYGGAVPACTVSDTPYCNYVFTAWLLAGDWVGSAQLLLSQLLGSCAVLRRLESSHSQQKPLLISISTQVPD